MEVKPAFSANWRIRRGKRRINMIEINLRDLLEAGCHFGHEVKRWNPKAKIYIYTERDGIHIIDLLKTKEALTRACVFAQQLGSQGKKLLFLGTKRQAKPVIIAEAKRVGAPYFGQRWVGGFITNWSEIKKNIEKLNQMDKDKTEGNWQQFVKHEQLALDRERMKLAKCYGGVKALTIYPDALYVIDIRKESGAIKETQNKGIPVIGITDTNSDPTRIEYPVPANDDAIKSITLITKYIADAYYEGLLSFQKKSAPQTVKPKTEVKTPVKDEKVKENKEDKKPVVEEIAKPKKRVRKPKKQENQEKV